MIQQATDAMGGIVCINDLKHSGHLQIVKEVRDNLKMSQLEQSVCPSILMRWNRYGKMLILLQKVQY